MRWVSGLYFSWYMEAFSSTNSWSRLKALLYIIMATAAFNTLSAEEKTKIPWNKLPVWRDQTSVWSKKLSLTPNQHTTEFSPQLAQTLTTVQDSIVYLGWPNKTFTFGIGEYVYENCSMRVEIIDGHRYIILAAKKWDEKIIKLWSDKQVILSLILYVDTTDKISEIRILITDCIDQDNQIVFINNWDNVLDEIKNWAKIFVNDANKLPRN